MLVNTFIILKFLSFSLNLFNFRQSNEGFKIHLNVVNSEKSHTLAEFLRISKSVHASVDGGKQWLWDLCDNNYPFNRQDKSNDHIFYR